MSKLSVLAVSRSRSAFEMKDCDSPYQLTAKAGRFNQYVMHELFNTCFFIYTEIA